MLSHEFANELGFIKSEKPKSYYRSSESYTSGEMSSERKREIKENLKRMSKMTEKEILEIELNDNSCYGP